MVWIKWLAIVLVALAVLVVGLGAFGAWRWPRARAR
jgi:multisubunit Na+/H+ antiporter MnhG subunit